MTPCPPRFRRHGLSMAALALVLAGCAAPAPDTWRVAPNYRVSHAVPSADSGYRALARQYEGQRRWRDARDAWRKAALEAPQDADILNELGQAEAGQGLYGRAVEALRRAVALAPKRVQLLNNLGYALLLDGQGDEARIVLQQALAQSPEHPMARANLARIDELQGDTSAPTGVPLAEAEKPTDGVVLNTPPPVSQPLPTVPELVPLPLKPLDVSGAAAPTPPPAPTDNLPNAAKPAASTVSAVSAAPARIEIANGNGVTGLAASLSGWLRAHGLQQKPALANVRPFNTATTVIHYRQGYLTAAQAFAQRMPQRVQLASEPGDVRQADIRVVLGRDLRVIDPSVLAFKN